MPCLVSSFWLNLFCITGFRLIHITTTDSNLFLFTDDWYSFVFMYHSLFIHLSVHEHLGYFHFLYRPQFGSVQLLSHVRLFVDPMNHSTPGLPVHHPTPGVHPKPCPLSRWCHPTISSSVVPFSSCPQSFPALGSFQMSQLFASCGQSIGVSASTSVLPMNTQDWSPLGWTGWISLQSKGLSRAFSNTTVQRKASILWHSAFFIVQLSHLGRPLLTK